MCSPVKEKEERRRKPLLINLCQWLVMNLVMQRKGRDDVKAAAMNLVMQCYLKLNVFCNVILMCVVNIWLFVLILEVTI